MLVVQGIGAPLSIWRGEFNTEPLAIRAKHARRNDALGRGVASWIHQNLDCFSWPRASNARKLCCVLKVENVIEWPHWFHAVSPGKDPQKRFGHYIPILSNFNENLASLIASAHRFIYSKGKNMAKVLVIDDEQGIRHLLDTLLRRKGYTVVLADGGRKGLELFRRERPDAVVLDLKMPEMDGIAVLQQLRSVDHTLPVIVLTGAGTPEIERQVNALGMTEFIEKEFSMHRLGEALKRLIKTPDHATNPSTS